MNKRVLYSMMMTSCLLLAGQVSGQTLNSFQKHKKTLKETQFRNSERQPDEQPVFPLLSGSIVNNLASEQVARPTTIFREDANTKKKYECEYDIYGHITSLKYYIYDDFDDKGGNYVYRDSFVNEYHQLPNGEFVKTKEEFTSVHGSGYKKTSAYDSKGLQLWEQTEFWDNENRNWRLAYRKEAVLNENNVRIAMQIYNPDTEQMEPDNRYTFDSKGRITHYEQERGNEETEVVTYTWDDNNRIIECTNSWTVDDMSSITVIYTNIQTVWNEKYFNQYSLIPISFDDFDYNSELSTWGNFAAEDYTLHRIFYNTDAIITVNGEEQSAQLRTTINADRTQITETVTAGSQVTQSIINLLDKNGSYHIKRNNIDGDKYEKSATYNDHGELTRKYLLDSYTDGSGEERRYEREYVYDREYDSQDRPVKTTYSESSGNLPLSEEYKETYTTWTTIALLSGIEKASQPSVSVYPNPATNYIVIDNAPAGATITINDVSGRTVHKQILMGNKKTVPLTSLPQGIYLVTLQTENQKIINKIVKK
jgi:hypothetical protein